jgi:type III secretory pathway component EscU
MSLISVLLPLPRVARITICKTSSERLTQNANFATLAALPDLDLSNGRKNPKGTNMRIFSRKVFTSMVKTGIKLMLLYQGIWFALKVLIQSQMLTTRNNGTKIYHDGIVNCMDKKVAPLVRFTDRQADGRILLPTPSSK